MGRRLLLLLGSVTATVLVGLGLVRWLAPQLLGTPVDLQVVQVDERVVPFYENLFRSDDEAHEGLLKDPYVSVRLPTFLPEGHPLGPTDALGFRNPGVPNRADVIAIGDSHTFGTGVAWPDSWPAQLARALPARVYSMAAGGWGAVQYLDMFEKAQAFRPRVAIIAFYTGNDPLESFRLAYSVEHWASLRPEPRLGVDDLPRGRWPVPMAETWHPTFADGTRTRFTPQHRLRAQLDRPAVVAGWEIMAEVAARIVALGTGSGVVPIFAILPTKESALAARIERDEIRVPPTYAALVDAERRNVAQLAGRIEALGARVVDLLPPLQQASLSGQLIYPRSQDGHPRPRGYRVVAQTLAAEIRPHLDASARAAAPAAAR